MGIFAMRAARRNYESWFSNYKRGISTDMVQSTEQKFGIVSDFLGSRDDIPTLKMPSVFMPESSGVFLQYGLIRTMPG